MGYVSAVLAMTLASAPMTETELRLFEAGLEWKERALKAESESLALKQHLDLALDEARHWRREFTNKPPVEVEVTPPWVPIVIGASLGAASGGTFAAFSGVDSATAVQGVLISTAVGAGIGAIFSLF